MEEQKKRVGILFIGNSHTYYNDMPLMVRRLAEGEGYACRVTMIAHGGWYLDQHAGEPDVRFNILHGGYDYVVLQEHAHPFGPVERFTEGADRLAGLIQEAGSIPVLYECWARKEEPEAQAAMNEAHEAIAERMGALLAPVGERWWKYRSERPDLELYWEDGAHASPAGSGLAARVIWETIRSDLAGKERNAKGQVRGEDA